MHNVELGCSGKSLTQFSYVKNTITADTWLRDTTPG